MHYAMNMLREREAMEINAKSVGTVVDHDD